MSRVIAAAMLLAGSIGLASTHSGTVQLFQGRTVETNRPYSYFALATENGQRILLPELLSAAVLHRTQDHVTIEGDLEPLFCTDMSRACATGSFSNVRYVRIFTGIVSIVPFDRFEGFVRRFQGNFVEQPDRTYDYLALETADDRRIGVPAQLDARALSLGNAPRVVLTGSIRHMMCTDMSAACGPEPIGVLQSAELIFE